MAKRVQYKNYCKSIAVQKLTEILFDLGINHKTEDITSECKSIDFATATIHIKDVKVELLLCDEAVNNLEINYKGVYVDFKNNEYIYSYKPFSQNIEKKELVGLINRKN